MSISKTTLLDIAQMDVAELEMITAAIKARKLILNPIAAVEVGDAVYFDANTRGIIKGRVEKINPKTVIVRGLGGDLWKVSPGLIKRQAA